LLDDQSSARHLSSVSAIAAWPTVRATRLAPSNRVVRAWTRTGETDPTLMGDKVHVTGSYTEPHVATISVEANDSGSPKDATFRDGFWIARGVQLDDKDDNTLEATITDLADYTSTYPVSPATYPVKLDRNLNVAYEYDAAGNIIKKTQVVDYDEGGGDTYITRYFDDDPNGNTACCMDEASLRRVSRYCGDVHYVYGPTGQRVAIEYGEITLSGGENFSSFNPSSSRGFVCMGGNVLEEWTVSGGSLGSLVYRYVRNPATNLGGGIGSIAYQIDGSDYRYYHYNHKGDTGALTDGDGKIVAWYEYDAWGNVVTEWEASGVENEFRFSTKQWDATPAGPPDAGLIYFGARYLDPQLGRWTKLDPAGTVDGINMYLYARNAPVFAVDAYGYQIGASALPYARCTPGPDSPPFRNCPGFQYYGLVQGRCVPVCVLPPGGVPTGAGYIPPSPPPPPDTGDDGGGDASRGPCAELGINLPSVPDPECCDVRYLTERSSLAGAVYTGVSFLSKAGYVGLSTIEAGSPCVAISVMRTAQGANERSRVQDSVDNPDDPRAALRADCAQELRAWLTDLYSACCE